MSTLAKNFDIRIKSRNDFGVGLRIGDLHYTLASDIKFSVESVSGFISDVLANKVQGKLVVGILSKH